MTIGTASDQCPAVRAQVSVRFNQPGEFVAELQARGRNLESLVRLTLVGRGGRLRLVRRPPDGGARIVTR